MCTSMCEYVCLCVCVYVCVCVCVCVWALFPRMYVRRISLCARVCVCVYMCVCFSVYTQTHTRILPALFRGMNLFM